MIKRVRVIKHKDSVGSSFMPSDQRTRIAREAECRQPNIESIVTDWIDEWREARKRRSERDLHGLSQFKSADVPLFSDEVTGGERQQIEV